MVKVVVVEDKPPILWSIKQKIENYSLELKVVGEAYNGQEALTLINELQPDIVFTDIKMPLMDGLELISLVKKTHPNIHFVIISGYDEFEYARQAIKLGVSDYILKPITQETMNDILSKIICNIKANVSQREKNLLQSLLNSGQNVNLSNQHFDCQYFITALFCAGSYTHHIIDYTNPFNFFWSRIDYGEIISKHIRENLFYWYFDRKSLNEMILLLGVPKQCNFNLEQVIYQSSEKLLSMNIPISIAISRKISNVNSIGIEAQNTRMLLRKNLVFGKPGIIFSDTSNVDKIEKGSILDSLLEKKLASLVQGHQKSLFLLELKKIIDFWDKNNFTQYNLERSLKYIVQICIKAILDKSNISRDVEIEIEEILCISKDYTTLFQSLSSMFNQFFPNNYDVKQKREPMKEIIDKVEGYINANFSEQITINDIADMVKVDPCHLSKAFKNIKGISPMEYLTKLRIEKSKDMLSNDSNLMLKDIAEIVGYSNQYYFSRIFKIITGLSPSEFRNSGLTDKLE